MSSSWRKIKYNEEGSYGSTESKYLYIKDNASSDITTYFDDNGEYIMSHSDREFNLADAIAFANSRNSWNSDKMEHLNEEDMKLFRNR